jgi:ABC-2 type transport system permease protein
MSLWRLEWLRLVRTRRLGALLAVFLFFGLTAAPLARYLNELLAHTSGGMRVIAPPPTPADGIKNYVSNTAQLGLLAYVLVAASALAIDAHRETAVFFRSRVPTAFTLVVPRYLVSWAAGCAAFGLGALAAWYGTALLLGAVPASGMLAGIVAVWLFLAFAGALTAAFATRFSSVVGPTAATLGIALGLGILGGFGDLGRWMPSSLLTAMSGLAAGEGIGHFLPSAAVTVVATVALLALTARLAGTREL